jgi:hypothetical protein
VRDHVVDGGFDTEKCALGVAQHEPGEVAARRRVDLRGDRATAVQQGQCEWGDAAGGVQTDELGGFERDLQFGWPAGQYRVTVWIHLGVEAAVERRRRDHVGLYSEPRALPRDRTRHPDDAHLGRRVDRLPEGAA